MNLKIISSSQNKFGMTNNKAMMPYFVIDQIFIGPIKLYTWGLFVGLGFSAGYLLFYHKARRAGLAPKNIAGLGAAIFFGAISGAKILAWALAGGGAMFMAGLVGAIIFGYLYVILVKLDIWRVVDLLVLPILLGITIGRIGCVLINDHQGAPTSLPWGILWPDGIMRHPIGTYEALVGLGLFGVFWWAQKKILPERSAEHSRGAESKADPSTRSAHLGNTGLIFLLFLLSYSLIRFFLEFTRASSGPLADPRWGVFSVSQWISLLLLTVSIFVVLLTRRVQQ